MVRQARMRLSTSTSSSCQADRHCQPLLRKLQIPVCLLSALICVPYYCEGTIVLIIWAPHLNTCTAAVNNRVCCLLAELEYAILQCHDLENIINIENEF